MKPRYWIFVGCLISLVDILYLSLPSTDGVVTEDFNKIKVTIGDRFGNDREPIRVMGVMWHKRTCLATVVLRGEGSHLDLRVFYVPWSVEMGSESRPIVRIGNTLVKIWWVESSGDDLTITIHWWEK